MLDPTPVLQSALAGVEVLWSTPLAATIPWWQWAIPAAISGLGTWLGYRGAGQAADAQLSAADRAMAAAEKRDDAMRSMAGAASAQGFERTLANMGTRYNTFALPILNRWGTGWPTQGQYTASLRGRGGGSGLPPELGGTPTPGKNLGQMGGG